MCCVEWFTGTLGLLQRQPSLRKIILYPAFGGDQATKNFKTLFITSPHHILEDVQIGRCAKNKVEEQVGEKITRVSEREIFRLSIYGVYFWTSAAILEINFWMVLSGA